MAMAALANCSSRTSRCDRNTPPSTPPSPTPSAGTKTRSPLGRLREAVGEGGRVHAPRGGREAARRGSSSRRARARRRRRRGPSRTRRRAPPVADHAEHHRSSPMRTVSIAPAAARMPQRIGRLEGRAGRRGRDRGSRSREPRAISQFVPTSMNRRSRLSRFRPLGEQAGDDVAADVGAERREAWSPARGGVDRDARVGGGEFGATAAGPSRTARRRAARGRCRAPAPPSSRCRPARSRRPRAASTSPSSQTSCASASSVERARPHSRSSASGSSIVAEMRAITSAPKGCWRLSFDAPPPGSRAEVDTSRPRSSCRGRSRWRGGGRSCRRARPPISYVVDHDRRHPPARAPREPARSVAEDAPAAIRGAEVLERVADPLGVAALVGQARLL